MDTARRPFGDSEPTIGVSSSRSTGLRYRPDIDGLRALAIILVLAYHAFPAVVPGGFIGVDVFFVISGFLITAIIVKHLDRGDFSFLDFYARRIRRIFPALIVVLSASFAFGWIALLPGEFAQLGKHISAGAGFVQNIVLWRESGYFDTQSELKPLLHLWSLAVEEQFYVFYPLVLWTAARLRLRLLAVVLGVGLVSFALNLVGTPQDAIAAFYLPQTRLWELMAGCALACVQAQAQGSPFATRRRHPALTNALSLVGLALICGAAAVLDRGAPFPGWRAMVPVAGTSLLVIAGPGAWINARIFSQRMMVSVGLISYPLYLWHWPLLSFARVMHSDMPDAWTRAGVLGLSVLLAWLTYAIIERPIRFRPAIRRRAAPALAVLMILVGCLPLVALRPFHYAAWLYPAGEAQGAYFNLSEQGIATLREQRQRVRRWQGQCDFVPDQGVLDDAAFARMAQTCLSIVPDKRNVLIIGDSHAADLWGAMSTRYPAINFLQATGSGCPVSLANSELPGVDPGCRKLVSYVYRNLDWQRIDHVLATRRWRPTTDLDNVLRDLQWIQDKGPKVVVLGPTVEFRADLPKIVLRGQNPDDRLNWDKIALDRHMQQYLSMQLHYVSKIGAWCRSDGAKLSCDWHDGRQILIWDYGHLTVAGMAHLGAILQRERLVE